MPDKLIGKTLGDFRIEELLGRGSAGRVYRATQVSLNRPVALKVLEEGLFTLDDLKRRFLREAQYIARLEHPNIVPVYTAGQQDNVYFFAMRLMRGSTLTERMTGRVPMRDGVRWLAEIASALHYAHEQGLIHRDVKPANIMIADGSAVLLDLGIARLRETTTITTSGALVGTPLYFSPEQARLEKATHLSDLYALGIILYEIAAGRHPFAIETDLPRDQLIARIAAGSFPPPRAVTPSLPEGIERVILKALSADPAGRFQNGGEMRDALLALLAEPALTQDAPATASRHPTPRPRALIGPPATTAGTQIRPDETSFGKFRLQGLIGHGGMGAVYRAYQPDLDRTVALKVLISDDAIDTAAADRFLHEARAAARLHHPNIVPIHEVGEIDGKRYFTMQLIDGSDLASLVEQNGPLPARRALEILRDVARAVQHAHDNGIIHRDLKPANILIDRDNRVHVTDFGLAKQVTGDPTKLTRSGDILGTPAYMSPEQAAGETRSVGPLADVYALGAVLYTLLTGKPPFVAESALQILIAVLEEEPAPPRSTNPSVHIDAQTICLKAMEKDPARRYASAAALADDAERFGQGEPIEARSAGLIRRAWRRLRGRKAATAIGAGIVAVVVAVAIVLGSALGRSAEERRRQRADALLEPARGVLSDVEKNIDSIDDRASAGLKQRAFSSIEAAHRADPTYGEPWRIKAKLHEFLCEFGQMEDAARCFVSLNGRAPLARLLLGRALLGRYRDLRGLPFIRYSRDGRLEFSTTPETPEERRLRGEAIAAFDEARRLLGSARPTAAADEAYIDGALALSRGDDERARERLKAATEAYSLDALAFFDLGMACHHLQRFEEACEAFGRALKLNRLRDVILRWRATSQTAIGARDYAQGRDGTPRFDSAWRDINQSVELASDVPHARLERALLALLWAEKHGSAAHPEEELIAQAIKDADSVISIPSCTVAGLIRRADARRHLAQLRVERGDDPGDLLRAALDDLSQAMRHTDDSEADFAQEARAVTQIALAKALAWTGSDPQLGFEAAIADYEACVARQPAIPTRLAGAAEAHALRAEHLIRTGGDPLADLKRAEELLTAAARRDATYAVVPYVESRLHQLWAKAQPDAASDRLERAAASARRAAELGPGLPELRLQIAQSLLDLGRHLDEAKGEPIAAVQEACSAADAAVALEDAADAQSIRGAAHCYLARLRMMRGQPHDDELAAAEQALTRAVKLNSRHETAYSNLGDLHATRAKAVLLRGDDPTSAWIAAAAAYERGLEIRPGQVPVENNLGTVYGSLADWARQKGNDPRDFLAKAAAAFERAAASDERRTDGQRSGPGVTALENLAHARLQLGEDARARRRYDAEAYRACERACGAILAVKPQDVTAFYWRGVARYRLRDFKGAVADFEQAVSLPSPRKEEIQRWLDLARKAAGGRPPE